MEESLIVSEVQLKEALEIARTEYQNAISRFRDLDNKLNMMLVLAVGILAAMGIVISSSVGDTASVCIKILLGIISLLIFIAVATIVIGLLPQKYDAPDLEALSNKNSYAKDNILFLGSYVATYNMCCSQIERKSHWKSMCIRAAVVILSVTLLTLVVTTIIWLWR